MSRVELGRPVIKEPVWTWEIPLYFYTGGLGGASAGLAWLAERTGNRELARRAWGAALLGCTASPALLISDLGRPARFLNMLRLFKITSPMSVGSWLLAATGPAVGVSALEGLAGRARGPASVAKPLAAVLGLLVSTYTAALLADTAIPVWHEGRRLLPASFAGSAAASAGAAAVMATPARHAAPARRLTLIGTVTELAATEIMERRLGDLAEPYRTGPAAKLSRAAKLLGAGGAALVALRAERSRAAAVAGGAMVTAGSILYRWSVFRAGFQSAADPWATVRPQRERVEARSS
jgi:DMSO reductase anchor subunit